MAHVAGSRSGNSTVPYSQTTQRTKEVDLTFSSTPAGWNLKAAKAVAYADSDGNWWIQMSVNAAATTFTSGSVSVDGIVFRNISNYFQTLIAEDSVGTSNCYVAPNSNTVSIQHSPTSAAFVFSGAVALESKPAWADANMEASTDASIYIEESDITKSGIIDRSSDDCVSYFANAAQSISTTTVAAFDTALVDVTSAFSSNTYTCTKAGIYNITFTTGTLVTTAGSLGDAYIFKIRKNGTIITTFGPETFVESLSHGEVVSITVATSFAIGDTADVQVGFNAIGSPVIRLRGSSIVINRLA